LVKTTVVLIGAIVLLAFPFNALAQRGGGHGGGRGGARGGSASGGGSSDGNDFSRAVAVQGSDYQASLFHTLVANTQAARKLAHDLQQQAAQHNAADYSSPSAALQAALEKTRSGSDDLLKTFTAPQQSGLKKLIQKLEKANVAVVKQWTVVSRFSERKQIDSERISATAERLEKALAEFEAQQSALAAEMGFTT
jgi:hypothetical protein